MIISVVIPVYGCRRALDELHRRLTDTLVKITNNYEIILVDDYCPQNSWESIENICKIDSKVKGIHLSKNFGQATAITAGIDYCHGEWVVVMDCDLQDRPEHIINLYKKAQEGYDVVFAKRKQRKDSRITLFLSKKFYQVLSYFTDETIDSDIGNFSISKKRVIENYCKIREHNRTYQLFIKWLGFKQTSIDLESDERFEGKSSYSFNKKMRFATSIITTHSNKPLFISIKLGFLISTLSIIYILILIILVLGIIGIYIGNIFNEVKNRPIYVVSEMLNCESNDKENKKCSTD